MYNVIYIGVISRFDAEKLLLEKPLGTYLVRVSEKVWGYTISYRAKDRCKHFLIDASEEQYHFFGPNQLDHGSIIDLVNFHKVQAGLFFCYKIFEEVRNFFVTKFLKKFIIYRILENLIKKFVDI